MDTVSYMPPEQAMGGEVTPRSDLYSLGAMLCEMVTGRPPFLGDDSVAIIGQHINTPPVAPTWHNGQCLRAFDALILRNGVPDCKPSGSYTNYVPAIIFFGGLLLIWIGVIGDYLGRSDVQ